MSINHLFEISRRSFRSLDAAMNVVGQNVANANTEGYSRRRVNLQSDSINMTSNLYSGAIPAKFNGIGVSVQSVERLRDDMLFASSLDARTGYASAEAERRNLQHLEGVFPASGEGTLDALLAGFWQSWEDLSNNPADRGIRFSVRDHAGALTRTFNRVDNDLTAQQERAHGELRNQISDVNSLLKRVAELNSDIERAQNIGSPDHSAEEEREMLVAQLAEFVPVKIQEGREDGYTLTSGGLTLVQGRTATTLELDGGQPPAVRIGGSNVTLNAGIDGKIGVTLRHIGETIPQIRTELDGLVESMISRVNDIHQDGYGLDGNTDRDFFDPKGTTAASFRLSDDILQNIDAIAASDDPDAVGDNSTAREIAALRTRPLGNGIDDSAEDFVINLITDIGARVRSASVRSEGQAAVLDHIQAMSESVSAVSLDEEMTNLIKYQQAYAASARVLNTAQQMMDTLLAM